jgi:hypothetical protein
VNWTESTHRTDRGIDRASPVSRLARLLRLAVLAVCAVSGAVASAQDVGATSRQAFAYSDLDGDRRPDLAVIQTGRSDLSATDYWVQLRLTVASTQVIRVVAPTGGLQIAVRDVNGDDVPDLVLTTALRDQPVAILLNDGHGNFSRIDPVAYPNAFSSTKTDWNSAVAVDEALVALLSKSHTVAPVVSVRLPYLGLFVRAPRSPSRIVRAQVELTHHAGRAPPLDSFLL